MSGSRAPIATRATGASGGPAPLAARSEVAPGYEVVSHLSRGRALDVYDVWSEERQCLCVAKLVRPDRDAEEGPRARLVAEGRLLCRLTHPHIVRAYELIEVPGPILILETVEGETVERLARGRRRPALRDVTILGLHLCSAVHYLHRSGYLHLDLKPSNVISDAGVAKMIDLSLSHPPGRVPRGIGTRQYLSPEQARGGKVGPPADVWGIGAVLFEATTAQRPFRGLDDGRFEQLSRRAAPVSDHRRVPRAFGSLVAACLEPDAAERPDVMELARELDRFA
jgi:serine/threonine protein kinase